ncbi:hypothetical protein GCM10017691_30020 [Pseudonocardia petroleophila]|uniref:Alpha/beta fold hydrolase n=1 Tax=Pseudonocardia petroleophila TaxID=37331 RepID=A0A7G7MED3_9PSEU|nr:alpha/beta fold hydrolase [Pseudonocardia petroleophila]QNG51144.1 alpha/beta fold hydrolase [Pseudonocardia petroleophila]
MHVTGLDHLVLVSDDPERLIAWYVDVLGLEPLRLERWRAGEVPFASLRVDAGTIVDVQRGSRSGTNVEHLALVVDADPDALAALAAGHGVDPPRDLFGARGQGQGIYLRDPDGNGVELRTYSPARPAAALADPVDGFRLAHDDLGDGDPVVLLHGWPGDRHDFRDVVGRLTGSCRVVVPDLRGFGATERPAGAGAAEFAAGPQAAGVAGLIEQLGLGPVVVGGYDVGSRTAQELARSRPDLVRALVVSPPTPGAGPRVLTAAAQEQFWYQHFHRLALAEHLVDGDPAAARRYLAHFWSHWSGPGFTPDDAELDRLAADYGRPGAFVASVNWYRAGAGTVARSVAEQVPAPADRIAVPTTVLWPEHDPLFPREWSDRLDAFFSDVDLRFLDGVGHFVPIEAAAEFAAAILTRVQESA